MNCKLFFLFFVFLIPVSSSLRIGISPDKLSLMTIEEKEICKDFTLITDEEIIFIGEVLWAEEESRNINDYEIESEDLNIKVNYPEQTYQGKKTFCVTPKEIGVYYGVLKYKGVGTNYGVATWIKLIVSEKEIEEKKDDIKGTSFITGGVIIDDGEFNANKIFTISFVILLIILIIILAKKKKKTK